MPIHDKRKKKSGGPASKYVGPDRRSHRRRRKFERFPLSNEDENCDVRLGDEEKAIKCEIVDISQKNCTITVTSPIRQKSGIHVQFKIFGNLLSKEGQIITEHTEGDKYRYGIEFIDNLGSRSEMYFRNLSDRRLPEDLYQNAIGFSNRLKVWKTEEFYHYHRSDAQGAMVVDYTTNDYLGLSKDVRIVQAAQLALGQCGLGTAGPSIFAGDQAHHDVLASSIAAIKKMEACLLCPSGFTANSGLFTGLIQKSGTTIFLDEKDHASIYHGAAASSGKLKVFKHNDMHDLERKLDASDRNSAKVICVDGVYSMDGDLAPLDQIHRLAKIYRASLWVDDAHSFGVFGPQGCGIEGHFNLRGEIDIVTGSLSKTLGGFGGFVCAKRAVIDFLDHLGREFVYTTTLPSAICAGVTESLRIVRDEGDKARENLWWNARHLKKALEKLGLPVGPSDSPIIPIIFGHETLTQQFANELHQEGVYINAVTRPAVRRNESRLRLSVRADHNEKQIDYTIDAMSKVAKRLGLSLND